MQVSLLNDGPFTVVLIYNITYSMNPHFTEYELWEYGIECCLYNLKDELISSAQFTLYADCRKGNRPSFTKAKDPKEAKINSPSPISPVIFSSILTLAFFTL